MSNCLGCGISSEDEQLALIDDICKYYPVGGIANMTLMFDEYAKPWQKKLLIPNEDTPEVLDVHIRENNQYYSIGGEKDAITT